MDHPLANRKKIEHPGSALELASRLIYSLFKAAVRLAGRLRFSKARLIELLELAYFEELRHHSPNDLREVAEQLDLSLRSVATLNKKIKDDFFAPETEIAPLRRLTAILTRGPKSLFELRALAKELDVHQLTRALVVLKHSGWVWEREGYYHLATELRSFVNEDMPRRIDGLNHQMTILGESVWQRFMADNTTTAVARSWVFAANPADVQTLIHNTLSHLRHQAVDLEEQALETNIHDRFAITFAVTPFQENDDE